MSSPASDSEQGSSTGTAQRGLQRCPGGGGPDPVCQRPPWTLNPENWTASSFCEQEQKQLRMELNGIRFDPENLQTLRLEFAKANTQDGQEQANGDSKSQQHASHPSNTFIARDPYDLMGAALIPASSEAPGPLPFVHPQS
ncbi:RNA-binding protein with multiple splicing 2 [Plecturocebus cupreus]